MLCALFSVRLSYRISMIAISVYFECLSLSEYLLHVYWKLNVPVNPEDQSLAEVCQGKTLNGRVEVAENEWTKRMEVE